MRERVWFVTIGVAILLTACSMGTQSPTPQSRADEIGTVVASTMQAYTASPGGAAATQAATQFSGTPISFQYASFVIPNALAGGANTDAVPAVAADSGAPWDIAPAHLKFTLTGYQLQGKFHEPGIYVYPADEYAASSTNAAEQIDRIKKILGGGTLMKETLPIVPFFNAGPLIAAKIQRLAFQNGGGVRTLTQYAQYAAPINNRELFYHFQGLSKDGRYYMIAILPVTAPVLAEDEKADAAVPAEGVPIPPNIGPNEVYYFAVSEKLNSLAPDAYTPSLDAVDALIQSILLNTP
jgi:hypothetical protein